MKLAVFAIYDSKVSAYRPPVYARNRGEALRMWEDAVNDPQAGFGRHAGDFTFFEIGTFDDGTCRFDQVEMVNLGSAAQYLRAPQGVTPLEAAVSKVSRLEAAGQE